MSRREGALSSPSIECLEGKLRGTCVSTVSCQSRVNISSRRKMRFVSFPLRGFGNEFRHGKRKETKRNETKTQASNRACHGSGQMETAPLATPITHRRQVAGQTFQQFAQLDS